MRWDRLRKRAGNLRPKIACGCSPVADTPSAPTRKLQTDTSNQRSPKIVSRALAHWETHQARARGRLESPPGWRERCNTYCAGAAPPQRSLIGETPGTLPPPLRVCRRVPVPPRLLSSILGARLFLLGGKDADQRSTQGLLSVVDRRGLPSPWIDRFIKRCCVVEQRIKQPGVGCPAASKQQAAASSPPPPPLFLGWPAG